MFDSKIALIVRDDLAAWQRLNVVAFLASGITASAPDILGKPYIDALGRQYGNMAGQPMLVFASDLDGLQKAHRKGLERELTLIPYVEAMFSTGHDEANRAVFLAEDAENLNLVGMALHGPKKQVDKVIKGLKLHP
ncbi:MAG TPA: DUF2000 family protein [Enterobacteriaceae bacterium]|nr:DUF2000 family protein [Enterobacteriaceae bacterium]